MKRPAVVFGGRKWAVAEMDMNRLGTWERKKIKDIWTNCRARNIEKKN